MQKLPRKCLVFNLLHRWSVCQIRSSISWIKVWRLAAHSRKIWITRLQIWIFSLPISSGLRTGRIYLTDRWPSHATSHAALPSPSSDNNQPNKLLQYSRNHKSVSHHLWSANQCSQSSNKWNPNHNLCPNLTNELPIRRTVRTPCPSACRSKTQSLKRKAP